MQRQRSCINFPSFALLVLTVGSEFLAAMAEESALVVADGEKPDGHKAGLFPSHSRLLENKACAGVGFCAVVFKRGPSVS